MNRRDNLRYKTENSADYSQDINSRPSKMRGQSVDLPILSSSRYNVNNSIDRLKNSSYNDPSQLHQEQKLSQSNIYYKPGRLKRNQVGWDGVKLSEYVLKNLANNYQADANMLEKFKKQAEECRRKKKYAHLNNKTQAINNHENFSRYLPAIKLPLSPQIYSAESQLRNEKIPVQEDEDEESQQYIQPQTHIFRNVGINTNKNLQISNLQRYLKLKTKYKNLKSKYMKNKKKKPPSSQKVQNLKQLEESLVDISLQLKRNSDSLQQLISQDCKSDRSIKQYQTEIYQQQRQEEQTNPEHITLARNSLLLLKNRKQDKNLAIKKPTVVYTHPIFSKSINLHI